MWPSLLVGLALAMVPPATARPEAGPGPHAGASEPVGARPAGGLTFQPLTPIVVGKGNYCGGLFSLEEMLDHLGGPAPFGLVAIDSDGLFDENCFERHYSLPALRRTLPALWELAEQAADPQTVRRSLLDAACQLAPSLLTDTGRFQSQVLAAFRADPPGVPLRMVVFTSQAPHCQLPLTVADLTRSLEAGDGGEHTKLTLLAETSAGRAVVQRYLARLGSSPHEVWLREGVERQLTLYRAAGHNDGGRVKGNVRRAACGSSPSYDGLVSAYDHVRKRPGQAGMARWCWGHTLAGTDVEEILVRLWNDAPRSEDPRRSRTAALLAACDFSPALLSPDGALREPALYEYRREPPGLHLDAAVSLELKPGCSIGLDEDDVARALLLEHSDDPVPPALLLSRWGVRWDLLLDVMERGGELRWRYAASAIARRLPEHRLGPVRRQWLFGYGPLRRVLAR